MTETNPTGDRPAAHQQRLLATTASDVEPHVHDALNRFCAASSGVEAGYVCRVEQVWPDGKATERLSFMLRLDMPVRERGDGRPELFAIANRFAVEHPDLAGSLGIGVLADRAVAAWERNGVRVFVREPGV